MSSYKVYLTKSLEVAGLIAKAHGLGENNITRIGYGAVSEQTPQVFHNQGYFQCTIEYDSERTKYELIFA